MRCSGCGSWPPTSAKYCPQCGLPLAARSAPNPDRTSSIGARPVRGELRQLTVVFSDLVGSTELSTRLDPEEFGDVIARYHRQVVEVVERYRGEVVRYLGDGVLIEFGWPVAHEDDCERAVRAAIEITAAVEAADRELPREIALAVRVGVHTGPVLVGELGAGSRRETMALGETMNVAARLHESAAPGTAVISEATLRLVRGIFVTEELEPRTFKGLAAPLQVHRVVQPSGVRSLFDAASGRLTPFVGREAELEAAVDLWRRCIPSRRGAAVLISGEPGVGKSRLVYELRQRVGDLPYSWLECRCSSYTEHSAFRPATELLEQGLGFQPEDEAEHRLAKLKSALARTGIEDAEAVAVLSRLFSLPLAASSPPMSSDFQRRQTIELLSQWATGLARLQPLILLIEDLQWADPSTVELFGYLIEQGAETGLMLIGTARTEFQPPWPESSPIDRIELEPLNQREIRALVSGLGVGPELPDAAVERVVADAAGIPLFAEEIGWMLLESDMLVEREGALELVVPFERLEIPVTLQDSLMARLDRVNAGKRLMQHAAVIGREFDQELVEAVAGLNSELVHEGLEQLVDDQLLFKRDEPPHTIYTFKHALIQEAAYRSLLKRTRKELHAVTAQALDGRRSRGELDVPPEVIARHHEAAGLIKPAICYYREAAQQSAGRSGHVEAIEHLTRALGLLSALPEAREPDELRQRCELLLALGESQWNAGDFEHAQQSFREAAEVASERRLPEHLARAALGYGGRMAFGAGLRDEALIAMLEAGLKALPEDHQALRARVMARLAEALTFSEARERRASLCEQALAIARTRRDPVAVASVLTNEHWALWSPANLERRLAISNEIVTLAQQVNDRVLETEGRMWLVSDLMEAGDIEAVDREFEIWAALAEKLRQSYQLWAVAVARAMRTLMRGLLEEGESQAQQALEIGQRDRNQNAVQLFGVQLSNVRREQGRWHELEAPLKVFVEQFPSIPTWRCALAAMYGQGGRDAEARREFDVVAADGFAAFREDLFWLANITLAADTSAALGDVERASLLYEQLLPYPRRCVMAGPFTACWGSSSRTLGLLAATMARWGEAELHFQEALEQNRKLGARPWLARTQLEYAAMLSSRGAPADSERALELVAEVLETARELSLTDRARQAIELKTRLEGVTRPERPVA